MNLTQSDYRKIINYYQIPKQKNQTYKDTAENILATKLCKCIKKIGLYDNNESVSISTCRERIFKNRGIDFYNFKCKNKQRFISKKGTTKKLKKFRKKIGFNKTKKSKKINKTNK
jgi:hypothetical protein